MKAFVLEDLHSLNQNIMCKPEEDKHTKQDCETSTLMPSGQGAAAPQIIYAHETLKNPDPPFGSTVMLIIHGRDCYKEKGAGISSPCFFPNRIIIAYLGVCRTQASTALKKRKLPCLCHSFK